MENLVLPILVSRSKTSLKPKFATIPAQWEEPDSGSKSKLCARHKFPEISRTWSQNQFWKLNKKRFFQDVLNFSFEAMLRKYIIKSGKLVSLNLRPKSLLDRLASISGRVSLQAILFACLIWCEEVSLRAQSEVIKSSPLLSKLRKIKTSSYRIFNYKLTLNLINSEYEVIRQLATSWRRYVRTCHSVLPAPFTAATCCTLIARSVVPQKRHRHFISQRSA